jgi:DNA-binding transcriptional LysR family regulator
MNFQNMEYFLTAAEEHSITHAAEKLQISQQALSNTIARMESELGCRLFERRQGLELTYGGRKYRDAAIRILDIQKQTTRLLDDIDNNVRGELRIGISYTRGQAILPQVLPDFIKKYPLVELSVTEDSNAALELLLERGEIDVLIGFVPSSFEGAVCHELTKEHLYLVIPGSLLSEHFQTDDCIRDKLKHFNATHDISLFRDFPFVLLKKGDRIRSIADAAFSEAGFSPVIKLETRNTQTAVALAAEGIGITICPELFLNSNYIASGLSESYIRERVEICPLFDDSRSDMIAVSYNKDRYLSHAASDFIELCTARLRV